MDEQNVVQFDSESIAVVGMAARLPGAGDCGQFWDNLKGVVSSVREVPPDRWDADRYYSADSQDVNRAVSRWGGFIDGVDRFDPLFFGISPREARVMDPQQRILLELAWACVEDAGYAPDQLRGSRTGVFIGVMNADYRERLTEAAGPIAGHMSTGAYTALIPNRVSHFFDWHGPSLPVDTACSSSLVALHQALHALRGGECDQVLTGGVSVLCSPTHYVSFSKTGMLSPDGLCRTFDDRANGYVRSEGAGLLMLKPLSRALRDGDRVYGLIRGTAVNHGGKARTVTYPNPLAQAEVIATAHERAGVPPATVGYIEAHGTGTPKGDPIEIGGLKAAFERLARQHGQALAPASCGLGSLKANVGHLEPVAGVAGIIKVLLAMRHRTLPGLAHFQQLNHRIDLSDSPFFIVEKTQDWPQRLDAEGRALPRRAGVSSFGFGGVNAHAVVEEFLPPQETPPPAPAGGAAAAALATLVVLSARTAQSLHEGAQRLLAWLQAQPAGGSLADVAYTLQVGRSAMEQRLALQADSVGDLQRKLAAFVAGEPAAAGVFRGEAKPGGDALAALAAEDVGRLVADWLAQGLTAKVLELWTRGLAVDWARLYGPRRPQRISLPTYAFARERHWVDAPHQAGFDPAAAGTPAGAAGLQYFQERWVEQPLSAGQGRPIRTLLCFASRAETRQALAQGLEALGVQARLLFVADAATGAAESATVAVVDRGDAPSYARALERLQAAHGPADATLYLWALEDASLLGDFAPILFLLQAAGATRICRGPVLLAAQGDGAVERCRWESLIGFERSAGNALGGAAVAAVYEVLDGTARSDAGALACWTRRLWDELQAPQPRSAVYVEGRRHACQLAPIDAEASRGGHAVPLRQGGTYLVTGGLGGLGRLFAQHLLRQWGANVVLAGRSPLDETRRGQLQALAQAGGQVLYVQADVADAAQMAQCLAALKARFGALHGVLHAAGLENWKSLQDCSRADFEQVLAPKVEGTLVLERLLRDEPVDFLCCFSSSAAFVGDFGACSYAVGNRFQLALARLLRQRRPEARTLAIAWPLWQDGGMRVGDAQATAFYLQSTGQRLLQAGEGVAAFEALLSRPLDHALVMAGEPQRIRRLLKLDAPAAAPARPAAAPAAVAAHAAAASAAVAPPAGEPGAQALLPRVEQALLEMAAGILQVSPERLALDGNLADFGFDSINLAAFATALTRHYGIDVVPAVFFSYPTLERLARHLAEQHAPALQPLHGDAPPAAKAPVPPVAAAPAVPATGAAAQPRDGGDGDGDAAIAVIGMSGRFPGARDVGALWRLLDEGRSAVGAAPAERGADWAQAGYRCGFIDGVAEFDPLFFEISPREADHMDPRQRLLLQECWKALEDAGYGPARLQGRCVGTFVGIEDGDYHRVAQGAAAGEGSITSNHNGILAGRLAYFLDLDGPTLAINTACSSGLVALHQACLSLLNGECDTAIVAAANLLLTPHGCRDMEAAGMLSPTGACRTFDERADGMVPAEAVVVLVLKRLARARADEDRIHAVVAATGVNSDGRTNGITAPNGLSQARLIESVYRRHGIDPARIGCVVAHGTGTKLGDPVEVNALTQAFRALSSDAAGCALVSPKTNLGHALAASGLVSVVCLIEALRHEAIPASLNWERPNPFIHWQDSPFRVNDRKRPWPRGAHARMGAVSAFGMSGTNAHAVLREHAADARPAPAPAPGAPAARLFVLSAKTERALRQRIADMAAVFEHADAAALDDISHTLLERRHHFSHRCAFVAHGPAEAARLLRQAASRAQAPWCEGKVARGFRPQAEGQQRLQALLREHAAAAEAGDASRHQDALHALAGLYCEGYAVSGLAVPGAVRPRLASLPPYPFLAQHCWVRAAGPAEPAPQAVVPAPVREPAPVPAPTRGFSLRGEAGTLLLVPAWDAVAPEDFREGGLPRGRLLLVGGSAEDLRALRQLDPRAQALSAAEAGSAESIVRSLAGQPWVDHVVWRVPQRPAPTAALEPESLIAAQADGVLCGLRLVQALHALGYGARPLGWTVLTVQAQSIGSGDGADPAHASVHGLMGSLAKEQPQWRIRLADLPAQHPVALSEVLALPADRRGHAWAYRHGEWYRRQLMPVRPVGDFRAPYRDQGVYIVIGGAGDIGQAWSEHLAARHGARIVWVGRRELDADIAARLESVARLGPAPTYIRADASRREELQAVRQAVLARHGAVHGVVHAAMVFANQELAGMTEPQFRAALAAKVDVSVRVAQVFGQDALDFLLFFSSLISLIKNPRQAHYAAGCTFKDAFAQQLARTASCPVKVVNWGYWAARKNADAGEVRQLAELGIGLIEPADGMKALDVLLASSLHQVGVMSLEREFEVEGMDGRATVDVYPLSPCPGRAVDDEAPLPAA